MTIGEAAHAVHHGAAALGFVSAMPSGPGVIDADTIAALEVQVPLGVAAFLLTAAVDVPAIVAQQRRNARPRAPALRPPAARSARGAPRRVPRRHARPGRARRGAGGGGRDGRRRPGGRRPAARLRGSAKRGVRGPAALDPQQLAAFMGAARGESGADR
jgi:hypothetical protein